MVERGLTETTLSQRLGMEKSSLYRVLAGSRGVGFETGVRLARALGVSPDFLAFGEEAGNVSYLHAPAAANSTVAFVQSKRWQVRFRMRSSRWRRSLRCSFEPWQTPALNCQLLCAIGEHVERDRETAHSVVQEGQLLHAVSVRPLGARGVTPRRGVLHRRPGTVLSSNAMLITHDEQTP
jgi:transcriptional regulator with XRE-family HTH domain